MKAGYKITIPQKRYWAVASLANRLRVTEGREYAFETDSATGVTTVTCKK